MVSNKKLANAVGGKTARACDSCIRKRARWYCTADDAFLCEGCDHSVHSANPLARRHERVRLKTSCIGSTKEVSRENSVPSWHQGFTRKARTPRQRKSEEPAKNLHNLVPEIGSEEISNEENENEEQLLYRVPVFDPFVSETHGFGRESKAMLGEVLLDNGTWSSLHGFLPSEYELAEFAADVESLLGNGFDGETTFGMEALGLLDCKRKDSTEEGCSLGDGRVVKVEDEEEMNSVMANCVDTEIDITREPFELNFDYDSPLTCEEEEITKVGDVGGAIMEDSQTARTGEVLKRKKLLRLDYQAVISAWADQRPPWTSGNRPELDPTDCWPDCLGSCGTFHINPYGDIGLVGGHSSATGMDGGREARVSRYREKRRTRLFSKKIRYEVRKLNAEKRPRMKGRFVKRANFAAPAAFPLLHK